MAILAQFTFYGGVKPFVESEVNSKKESLRLDTSEAELQTTDLEESVHISEMNEFQ